MEENKWTDAINLCRTVNDETVWACLAVLATQLNSETLDIAEEAYANINHHEKVLYLQYIKVKNIWKKKIYSFIPSFSDTTIQS